MWIDTHTHLNFSAFHTDLASCIARARSAGVSTFIIPGAKLLSSKEAVGIAHRFDGCFAAVGIHPHHVSDREQFAEASLADRFAVLEVLAHEDRVVAIGETGLDYHVYAHKPPLSSHDIFLQHELFSLHVSLAASSHLPLIFHCRDAHHDMLPLVSSFQKKHGGKLRGVFHCFDGTVDQMLAVVSEGFFIGFDGNITYPENSRLHEVLRLTPRDRILLETDSPFLSPVPFRGKRNESANIPLIGKCIASLLSLPLSDVLRLTSSNAARLFSLPSLS